MKRIYENEQGVALLLAMILSLIVLATVSALLYLITQETSMSGYQKRYETALEGAKGGVNIVAGGIMPNVIGLLNSATLSTIETTLQTAYNVTSPYPLNLSFSATNTTTTNCLYAKLTNPQVTGATNNWTVGGCTADMQSTSLTNAAGAIVADMSFVLPGPQGTGTTQNYIVYAKIADTTLGNTDTSGLDLQGSGVVQSGSGMISPPQVPYLYRIEFLAQRQNNPDEKSQISALYAY